MITILTLVALGCRGPLAPELGAVEEGDVVAAFPPDGALRMWGEVPVQVVLGADADLDEVEVSLRQGGANTPLPCVLDAAGVLARCGTASVAAGEDLVLVVEAGGERHRFRTEGRLPEPGLGWSLLEGVAITTLGSGSQASDLASDQLSRGEMFAALDGYDGTSGSWTFLITPSGVAEDGTSAVSPWGFGFLLPVTVASDGRMWGRSDTAWLSIPAGAAPVLLLLLDVRLDATLVGEELHDLVLEAVAPGLSLDALASALGGLAGLVDLVKLDVDRNSDGVFDAATIRLEGSPAPAALRAWQ